MYAFMKQHEYNIE